MLSFDEFLKGACPALDLNWRKYRRRSVRKRVECRMKELDICDFASYLELIKEDPAEATGLPDLMRVTISRFFRERELWDELGRKALPDILDEKQPDGTIRAWSAGCCCGEEPYTLAIIWLDRLQPRYPGHEIEVLATDIDETALKRAKEGRYAKGSIREVPAESLERWFSLEKGLWSLDERVKQLVRFEQSNLLTYPPPIGMDIVLCRYLAFTYYSGERLLSAATRLFEALRPGGLLMVGHKERLPHKALELFHPLHGLPSFYRRP